MQPAAVPAVLLVAAAVPAVRQVAAAVPVVHLLAAADMVELVKAADLAMCCWANADVGMAEDLLIGDCTWGH